MNTTVTVLICVFGPLAYLMMTGTVARRVYLQRMWKCRKSPHHPYCHEDHVAAGVFAGIFWPIILPALIGLSLADNDRPSRLARKRQKELDEATHRRRLAEEARLEAEQLNQRLRALGKEDA